MFCKWHEQIIMQCHCTAYFYLSNYLIKKGYWVLNVQFSFFLSNNCKSLSTMWVTRRESYKKQELLIYRSQAPDNQLTNCDNDIKKETKKKKTKRKRRWVTSKIKQVKSFTSEHFPVSNLINHVTLRIKVKKKYSDWIWRFDAREGKTVKSSCKYPGSI